ncbi:MAG: hypothetical protein LH468_01010 [Nocardioides sp.]|nr:hypothetical protein [Nocardioides sp.]
MTADLSQAYSHDYVPPVPGPVRAARVLLLVGAALTLVTVLAFVVSVGPSPESIGRGIWVCVPAVIALVVAPRMGRPGRKTFWWAAAAAALWVLGALGSLGGGDPRGLTQLVIPVVVLVLLTRPRARAFFRNA